jgi:hypothetical protein
MRRYLKTKANTDRLWKVANYDQFFAIFCTGYIPTSVFFPVFQLISTFLQKRTENQICSNCILKGSGEEFFSLKLQA